MACTSPSPSSHQYYHYSLIGSIGKVRTLREQEAVLSQMITALTQASSGLLKNYPLIRLAISKDASVDEMRRYLESLEHQHEQAELHHRRLVAFPEGLVRGDFLEFHQRSKDVFVLFEAAQQEYEEVHLMLRAYCRPRAVEPSVVDVPPDPSPVMATTDTTASAVDLEAVQLLEQNTEELVGIFHDLQGYVQAQQTQLDTIEDNLVMAEHHTFEGVNELQKAQKISYLSMPLIGGLIGTAVGGPLGLLAGSGVAFVVGSVAGLVTGAVV